MYIINYYSDYLFIEIVWKYIVFVYSNIILFNVYKYNFNIKIHNNFDVKYYIYLL